LTSSHTSVTTTGLAGFIGGGFAEFPLSARISLMPELDFVMKGGKFTAGLPADTSVRLNYLELPLLVKAHWDWPKVRVFANGGPALALLLSANGTDDSTGSSSDEKSAYNSVDLGIALGGGVALPISESMDVFFDGRSTFGILDVDASNFSSHNVAFEFAAGLEF
jgi:hypothetical protein